MSRSPRVLVVAYYFPPTGGGGVNRTLGVVRGLYEAGFTPIVLTVDDAAWPRDASRLAEVPARARVLRLPNPDWGRVARGRPRRGGAERRAAGGRLRRWLVPDLHVGWSALATPVAALLAATRQIDLVVSSCPPYSAHAPAWVARRLGVPWLADFRDGWTCCPTRADLPARRVAFERRLEDRVLRDADHVLFASDAVRQRCVARVPGLSARSETLLTGYDARGFAAARELVPARDGFEIVHAGTVGSARREQTLAHLLRALRAWQHADPSVPSGVRVRFLGAEPVAADAIQAAGLASWVRVEPAVPRGELARILGTSHLCLALAPPGARGGEPIPGKLYDAAGAGRPLLALAGPGALAAVIERHGLGAAIAPEATAELVERLRAARERAARGEPALPMHPTARFGLDRARSVARMVEICRELALPPGGACPSPSAS